MKKNDLAEIKKADIKTINESIAKIYKSLASLVLDKNMEKLKNKKEIKNKRRDLAQILTVKKQKELLFEEELRSSDLEKNQLKEGNENN